MLFVNKDLYIKISIVFMPSYELKLLLTVASKQTKSKKDYASFNDLICDLELACFSAPQGAER